MSLVKIATDGEKKEGSSMVPTFRAIEPANLGGFVPKDVPQFEQNNRVTASGMSSLVKLAMFSSPDV